MSIDTEITAIGVERKKAEDLVNRLKEAEQKLREAKGLENEAHHAMTGY